MAKLFQIVGFDVGKEFFGVAIDAVKEIIRVPDITPVPDTKECIEGVISLRGRIIPVVDMRKRIGILSADADSNRKRSNRILILELANKMVGLIVDSVSDIVKISEEIIEAPPDTISSSIGAEYVVGVGKLENRLIILLDITKLLNVNVEDIKGVDVMNPALSLGLVGLSGGKEDIIKDKIKESLEGGVI